MMRENMVSLAKSYVGCGSSHERFKYLDLLASDIEPVSTRKAMAEMSSCALTVRGLWRSMGCDHAILHKPYVIGMAMADIIKIAKDMDAWLTPSDSYTPDVGDAVMVGKPSHEHVYTIVKISDDDSGIYESVDGGQGVGGTSISLCSRHFETIDDVLYDINSSGLTRPIIGFVDISQLGLRDD